MKRARVIGAGLSGLAAAWRLARAGFEVEVVEAAPSAGGLIGTTHTPYGLVERGANAFLWTETTERWFRELGIEPVFPRAESRRRYIFRDGRPSRWPLTFGESVGLAGHASLAFLTRRFAATDHESVAAWSRRVLGRAAAEWIVAPALQGIYAAPADRLAARAVFGSAATKPGARRRRAISVAPRDGMGAFIDALVRNLHAHGATVTLVSRVDALDPSVPTVIATGARAAAPLVAPYAPAAGMALGAIETTAVVSATVFFPPHEEDVQGFGVLFPRGSGVQALGVLFNTSIFEGRGSLRSETWIYGAFDSPSGLPRADTISATIQRDREILTIRRTQPVALYSMLDDGRPAELPVYGPAVLDAKDAIDSLPPWLTLAGNYLGRLGVAKLLDVAETAAEAIASSKGPTVLEC